MDASYRHSDIGQLTHSSNYFVRDNRPIGVCIHSTAGYSSLAYLQADKRKQQAIATADYLIARTGERWGLVPNGQAAYHVGKSNTTFTERGGDYLSSIYIGVELENHAPQQCTWEQLDSLAELIISVLMPKYQWAYPFNIVGHYELAAPDGRRSDPQGFNWGYFMGHLSRRYGFVKP